MPLHTKNLPRALSPLAISGSPLAISGSPLAILGPGLIGGSLALAYRREFPSSEIRLWARRAAVAAEASRKVGGACRALEDPCDAVLGAGVVVLCPPVEALPELAVRIAPALSAEAAVCDVGSVKGDPFFSVAKILGDRFTGAHPMAGSERSGFVAARADLFCGAACIITPSAGSSTRSVAVITQLWESVGCRIHSLTPGQHDAAVARVSHAPHAAAAALALLAAHHQHLAGPGYRDCTRVALGSADLWTEIFLANADAGAESLRDLRHEIETLETHIRNRDAKALRSLLEDARRLRSELPALPARPEPT